MARGGEVYRGVSIIEQAPLGGCRAPPSSLSFKLWLVILWRKGLRTSIVGYLIPVCFLIIMASSVCELVLGLGFTFAYDGQVYF